MPEAISHSGNRSTAISAAKTSAGVRPIRVVIVDVDRHQPGSPVGDGHEPERRSAAEPFGGRPVAQDQRADRPGVVGAVERLGDRLEGRSPTVTRQRGSASRLSAQSASASPAATTMAPGGPVSLSTNPTVTSRDSPLRRPRVPIRAYRPRRDQVVLHGRRRGRVTVGGRQRLRCQDLPSVWVDGA